MEAALDRPLDLEDLDATPDDGNRYEVLNGAVVMTPPPGTGHQRASGELYALLRAAARPLGLEVFYAPTAWRIGPGQVPEPDLMVVRPEDVTPKAVLGAPLLVVEIMSPHGSGRDRYEKRRIYAEGGASWYWLVDPDEPSLIVLSLQSGVGGSGAFYDEVAHVTGDEAYLASEPLRVRVVPSELVTPPRAP